MKKLVFIILVLASFSILSSAHDFVDMPDNWSTTALVSAVDNGLLTGDGEYIKPDSPLTRAQLAAIVTRAFGATNKADISEFSDVPENAWYRDEIAKAYQMNVLKGVGNGLMAPEKNVTRQEAFVVLARAFCLEESTDDTCLEQFSDHELVSSWARAGMASMVKEKYVNGSNGKLNPQESITRAEFAQVMYNLVSLYVDSDEDLAGMKEISGNVIIRQHLPIIDGIRFDAGVLISDGINSQISFKNVTIEKALVVRGDCDIVFDGKAKEIVSEFFDIQLVVNGLNNIEKIKLTANSQIIDSASPTPSVPVLPPEPEQEQEDIWTGFH